MVLAEKIKKILPDVQRHIPFRRPSATDLYHDFPLRKRQLMGEDRLIEIEGLNDIDSRAGSLRLRKATHEQKARGKESHACVSQPTMECHDGFVPWYEKVYDSVAATRRTG